MRQESDLAVVAPLHAPVARRLAPIAFIDGQAVNTPTEPHAIARIMARVEARRSFTVFTLNLDHLVKRRADAAFRAAYARADVVTADGQPVVTLARRQGAQLERTTGADMILPLCAAAETNRIGVFLFGGSQASLDSAAERLKRRFPRLDIRGCESPAMDFDPMGEDALAAGRRIAASGARLCFVALGAPKQELFADRLATLQKGTAADGVGYVCIGAALDFISGHQQRAPKLFQRAGIEWVYRFATNPVRLGLRYARCAVLYTRLRVGPLPALAGRRLDPVRAA